MSGFRKTKHGLAICPFFIWQSEDTQNNNEDECDISLTLCTHPNNKDNHEGNCNKEGCPLIE